MGRPSKFQPDFIEQARKLAQLGATDREAAEFFEVAESTLHLWKHTQPGFAEALQVGKQIADARVEQSLYRKAVGYSHDAVKIMSYEGQVIVEPYVEHFAPDTTAAIFWLKNRQPERWRDVYRQEHTGKDGDAIKVEQVGQDADAVASAIARLASREGAAGMAGGTQH